MSGTRRWPLIASLQLHFTRGGALASPNQTLSSCVSKPSIASIFLFNTSTKSGHHTSDIKFLEMGIRGLIVFIIADKRHAYYNQMDSYPEGLGQDIVNFILSLNPEQWDEMAKKLEEVTVNYTRQPSIRRHAYTDEDYLCDSRYSQRIAPTKSCKPNTRSWSITKYHTCQANSNTETSAHGISCF